MQTQLGEWIGPILGGHIAGGEFSWEGLHSFSPILLRCNWCTVGFGSEPPAPVRLTPVTGKFRVPRSLNRILFWCQHLTLCSPREPPFSPVTTCRNCLQNVLRAFLPYRRNNMHQNLLFLQCLRVTVMNMHFLEHRGFFGGGRGGSVCPPTDCPSG